MHEEHSTVDHIQFHNNFYPDFPETSGAAPKNMEVENWIRRKDTRVKSIAFFFFKSWRIFSIAPVLFMNFLLRNSRLLVSRGSFLLYSMCTYNITRNGYCKTAKGVRDSSAGRPRSTRGSSGGSASRDGARLGGRGRSGRAGVPDDYLAKGKYRVHCLARTLTGP